MNKHIITISVIVLIGIALLIHFTCKVEPVIEEPIVEEIEEPIIGAEEIKEINTGSKRLRVQIR